MDQQYKETLDYLYAQLPMFSKYGKSAIKNSLDNIIALCNALDNPQQKFKSVHIAGTNGKGSTSHMLAAVLQQAGYKTGLYTSPHITDFRERLKIDGRMVSKEWVTSFTQQHKELFEQIQPSFFEVTVAMAFAWFAEQGCDIAVIETGLGGRLDSTNIIQPVLSVITNISYDHMDLLGDTLAKIAEEKAGIIKKGVPFVIGQRDKETEQVFFEHSIHKQCSAFYADAQWALVRTGKDASYQYLKAVKPATKEMFDLKADLLGDYQLHNFKTVLTSVEVLHTLGWNLKLEDALSALSQVKQRTGFGGRWEIIQAKPLIIADVGHNQAGVQEVMKQWNQLSAKHKHIVVGFVKDKDINAALDQFPKDNSYYYCNAQLPRALPAEELHRAAAGKGLQGQHYNSVAAAFAAALEATGPEDALLITGSFFIVGEAKEYWEELHS
ncbi:folylpolyglutamate synthase/dihydrofolate synthase family protein [Rurimicrobium arvi]|uniref:bifunctional folylpolyglutamate synthase/dihydrofolate synthase n=1 Tax=Rurimicrobium arvi TaxID=2049916 RepID=UPI0031DC7F8F